MNYDLLTWVEYFVGAFACCFGMFLSGKILLERNRKDIKLSRCLLLIPLTMFVIFNSLMFDNIIKMFGSLIVLFIMFKFIYEERSVQIFIYSIILYIILMLSDIIFALIISLFDFVFNISLATIVTNSIFSNTIIAILACTLTITLRKKLMKYAQKVDKASMLIISIQSFITIFVIISSINYLYIEGWKFGYKFILNTIIIFGSVFLTLSLIRQYFETRDISNKHEMLNEYLKTSTILIEKYATTNHKYKNNLIAIKGYMKSDIDEANKYVDHLLDNFQDKKYSWFSKLNYIPIDTIRYLIYYKLSKSEELNLKIFVTVSKEIKMIKKDILNSYQLENILEILGEYFDNANYASNESDKKELNFDLYLENDKLVFIISNTYKKKMDLNLITKNGYTTKGKGHGLGLYDVDKTIRSMNFLTNKYEVLDDYFVVTLTMDLSKLEK